MAFTPSNRSSRPAAAKNKSILNKTKLFRDCFTEDDIKQLAETIKELAFNDELSVNERKAYVEMILKYNIIDVSTEIRTEAMAQQTDAIELSNEEVQDAINALRESLIKD